MNYAHVAGLYDAAIQVDFDLPFYLEQVRGVTSPILELMCGTGRVSIPLLEAGAQLTCVDLSAEMLRLLQAKLDQRRLVATLLQADIRHLELDARFDLALIPFHALAELTILSDQQRALQRVAHHLCRGGRLVVPLHNPPVRLQRVDGLLHLWAEHPLPERQLPERQIPEDSKFEDSKPESGPPPVGGKLLLWGRETYDPETHLIHGHEFFEIYDPSGLLLQRRLLPLAFRLTTPAEFEALVHHAGLKVAALYGDYTRAPFDPASSPFMIWVLEK
jgi:SAM-dependent methyltransferase